MRKTPYLLAALCALGAAMPSHANFVVEPTFAEKLARADLVVIGTVTSAEPARATLDVLRTLKGEAGGAITVSTYSRIAELDPQCCVVGATYVMFLRRSPQNGEMHSVRGAYGMVRIGGPPNRIEVIRLQE
jgi:hypothetical protein